MKYCAQCGTKLDDDAVFCPDCGARQPGMKDVAPIAASIPKESKNNKGNGKGIAILVIIFALIIAAIVYFKVVPAINSKRSIDLTDYILTPEYDGFDGEGTIKDGTLGLDYDALQEAVDTRRGKNAENNPVDVRNFYISISADKTDSLQNGDKITVSLDYNAEHIEESYGLTFDIEGKKKTFTVSDLSEYKKVNAFDGLSLNFTGISPYLKVDLTGDTELKYYDIEINNGSKTDYIKAGDKITITLNEEGENALKEEGKEPKSLSYDVEVTDDMVSTYVTSLKDIQSDILDELKSSTDNTIESYKARNNITSQTSYIGTWFLIPREGHWNDDRVPVLVNIYSYQDTDYDGNIVNKYLSIYCPPVYIEGSGLVSLSSKNTKAKDETSDDTNSDESQTEEKNETFDRSKEGQYSDVRRYDYEQDLYQDVVQKYLDNYDYESTEGLASLGQ